MLWPWQKKAGPAPAMEMPQAPAIAVEPEDVDLAALSLTDLDEWLASPYWRVLHQWLGEEIETNREALVRGDVALATAGMEGMLYRSNEALRGGIIGMEFVRTLFPAQIREEIEQARLDRAKDEEDQ